MFFNVFKHVLPRARAWRLTIDKQLRQFFEGLAPVGDDAKEYYDGIYQDIDPQTTRCIGLWEKEFALPDTGMTEQERRDRLDSAWKALGGQSPRYIQDTLQNAGFDVYIHEWWWPEVPLIITVSGTGTAVDGDYNFFGIFEGRPQWQKADTLGDITYSMLFNAWRVENLDNGEYFLHPDNTTELPPKTGWGIGSDSSPAPTLEYNDPLSARNPLLYLRRGQNLVTYVIECGEALAECGEATAECGETLEPVGYPLVNKFIQTKTDTRSLCGESEMECGELSAECGDFLTISNAPKEYIVSGDPDTFPYYLYFGGETFPDVVTIDSKRRDEFESLCLKICPCQQWLGMLINYS
jgi:hypothetical protein